MFPEGGAATHEIYLRFRQILKPTDQSKSEECRIHRPRAAPKFPIKIVFPHDMTATSGSWGRLHRSAPRPKKSRFGKSDEWKSEKGKKRERKKERREGGRRKKLFIHKSTVYLTKRRREGGSISLLPLPTTGINDESLAVKFPVGISREHEHRITLGN